MPDQVEAPWLLYFDIEPRGDTNLQHIGDAIRAMDGGDGRFLVSLHPARRRISCKCRSEKDFDRLWENLFAADDLQIATSPPALIYAETLVQPIDHHIEREPASDTNTCPCLRGVCLQPSRPFERPKIDIESGSSRLAEEQQREIADLAQTVLSNGLLVAGQVLGVRAVLSFDGLVDFDAQWGDVSTALIAALHDTLSAAEMRLLEPVMQLDATVPEIWAGYVVGLACGRRGLVCSVTYEEHACHMNALLPLSATLGLEKELRDKVQGAVEYGLSFSHYEIAPDQSDDPDNQPHIVALRA